VSSAGSTSPAADAAEVLAGLRTLPGGRHLVGIRHQVHDEPDPRWLLREDVGRGPRAVADAGLAFDLLARPRELPAALEVARRLPELRLVVDRAVKPPIASEALEPWAGLLAPLAGHKQVVCKVSGLVTEADWRRWRVNDLVPYVSRLVDWFGPERLLFGSDWPVCLLAAGYDQVVAAYARSLGGLAALAGSARGAYPLASDRSPSALRQENAGS
jgi:L-fucono-1,5-lactonase